MYMNVCGPVLGVAERARAAAASARPATAAPWLGSPGPKDCATTGRFFRKIPLEAARY